MTNHYFKMSKEDQKEFDKKGGDWNLYSCLEYNYQREFELSDIKQVLAVITGENNGAYWHWILELNNGKFVYLIGGCDYTGWDCQSWADSTIKDSPFDFDLNKDLINQLNSTKNITWREKMDKEFKVENLPKIRSYPVIESDEW